MKTLDQLLAEIESKIKYDLDLVERLIQPEKSWIKDIHERKKLLAVVRKAIEQRDEIYLDVWGDDEPTRGQIACDNAELAAIFEGSKSE